MDPTAPKEIVVQGIAASPGIAHGQIFLYLRSEVEVPSYEVDAAKRKDEVARFEQALVTTRKQITKIQGEVERNIGAQEAMIFDAHLMALEDPALIGETIREFETTGRNVESCWAKVSSRYVEAFSKFEDEYLRERGSDIRDIAQRVLQNLLGQAESSLARLADQRVIVANEITPSDSASVDRGAALAIVTDTGSKTSHAVIVARSMKVPAVVGVRDLSRRVQHGDWALVDGYEGVVILNPTENTLFRYGKIRERKKTWESRLWEANREPAVTRDGQAVALMANIERPEEVGLVRDYRAQGVGLYRTEFLFFDAARLPNEEEQYAAYRAVAEGLQPEPVIIRTLDIGGDKPIKGNEALFPKENNPFLGFRAIRWCLENPEIFKTQLRAILRASAHGKVRLMYPMISGAEELARANAQLGEAMGELKARGQAFDENLAVGAMIEIPSAATTADLLAKDCAFFSIGTNDLIQYLLAIDRVNDRIAHLYEPAHPAVLRTLKHIVDEAHRAGIPVSVCGEMAGDPVFAALLLGLGVDGLSMTPPLIPAVRYVVRAMSLVDAKQLAAEALAMSSPREILAKCEAFHRERVEAE